MEGLMQIQEKTPLSYEQILQKYQSEGRVSQEKWQPEIDRIEQEFLKQYGMSSLEEFQKRIKDPQDPSLVALDVYFPTELHGYKTDILAENLGQGARIIVHGNSGDDMLKSSMSKELRQEFKYDFTEGDEPLCAVWNSGGIYTGSTEIGFPHKGGYIDDSMRGQDLAYGMYALHERIFGKQKSELAPLLSAFKIYMKLGFVPKVTLSLVDGSNINTTLQDQIIQCVAKNEDKLPFVIYMERE
jgi:hypothetical protein